LAASSAPEHTVARIESVAVLLSLDKTVEADRMLDTVLASGHVGDLEAGLALASLALSRRTADAAIAVYRTMLEQHGQHARVVFELAKLLQRQGSEGQEQGDKLFADAISQAGPHAWDIHNRQSMYFSETGRKRNAVESAKRALGCLDGVAGVDASRIRQRLTRWLAETQVQAQLPDEAVATLKAMVKTDPTDHEVHSTLGNMLRTSAWEQAEFHFLQAIQHSPSPSALYHGNLGALYHLRGLYDKASEHYNRALAIEPGNAGVADNLARMRRAQATKSKAK
jgi:tetratricopeptide (TPR) repeat protein